MNSKIRALMKLPHLLLLAVCLFAAGGVLAERADRSKPMNVEADALRYDDLKQTNVFTGRVVATKGTIIIRGARLDTRQDPDGYQYGVVTAEPGKRAFFRQKREGVDEYIEGEAETIEYDGKTDAVTFTKRAEMRRYKGSTVNDEVAGAVIVYNNLTDIFTVDGAPGGAPGTGSMGGRVRATLTPSSAASAPAAAAPVSPPLRSSPTLGGEKK